MALAVPSLEELLLCREVEDIVLRPHSLACFKEGSWHGPWHSTELNRERVRELSRQISEEAGLSLGLTQPTVDAFFTHTRGDCFRAHIAISPIVVDGPEITLRRLPSMHQLALSDFQMSEFTRRCLERAVEEKQSLLIAGGTGSGKSSLLTALMGRLPGQCRVLILEDSPELPLPNPLSSKLLCRPNRFGFRAGATWNLSDLVFESLRMRPDRLVLGECRGPEALALVSALQTGHRGLMTTLHAGSCAQALERFDQLAQRQSGDAGQNYRELWEGVAFVELRHDGARQVSWLDNRAGPHD